MNIRLILSYKIIGLVRYAIGMIDDVILGNIKSV